MPKSPTNNAHIIQGLVFNNYSHSTILEFATQTLDSSFNSIALPLLLSTHKDLLQRLEKQFLFEIGDAVTVCIDCDRNTQQHNYMWGIVKDKSATTSLIYITARDRAVNFKNQELKVLDSGFNKQCQAISERIKTLMQRAELPDAILFFLECFHRTTCFTDCDFWLLGQVEEKYSVGIKC